MVSILLSLGTTSFCTQPVSIPANNKSSVFPWLVNTHLQVPGKIARGEGRRPEQITTGNAWLYLWILFSCYSAIPCASHSLTLFKTGKNSMRQKDNGKCLTALVMEAWYSLIQISSDLFGLYLHYNLICFFIRLRLWKKYCWRGFFSFVMGSLNLPRKSWKHRSSVLIATVLIATAMCFIIFPRQYVNLGWKEIIASISRNGHPSLTCPAEAW